MRIQIKIKTGFFFPFLFYPAILLWHTPHGLPPHKEERACFVDFPLNLCKRDYYYLKGNQSTPFYPVPYPFFFLHSVTISEIGGHGLRWTMDGKIRGNIIISGDNCCGGAGK